MSILDQQERNVIQEADEELLELQAALQQAALQGAIDPESFQRISETAREVIARINKDLPPQLDVEASNEIRARLVDVLTTLPPIEKPLDRADTFLLEMEAVRHILRDVLHEQPPANLRDAAALVQLLEEWLPNLTVRQVAELLGMSERVLQRRRADGGASTDRAQLVARLVAILRLAWTDEGVYQWFLRRRRNLGGAAPMTLLDDRARERDLILEARAGRVQGAG